MAEVKLFADIPDKLRFPEATTLMYQKIQGWLNLQTSGDELWDVYDSERKLTGRLHKRSDPLLPGDYHLSVLAILQNTRGEYLITKRASEKGYGGRWENTGGAAQAGDNSLTAAVRELKEETGLSISPQNGQLLIESVGPDVFFDIWLFTQDFSLRDIVLQEKETVDARLASREEIAKMIGAGEFLAGPDVAAYFRNGG
jgi:8-oxo-dGTP pyrophosphatase MutT (NUDIX family)